MKNKSKKSSGLNPHIVRLLHIFRLTGFALGLSVLLALFALLVIGLPPGLTRRITAQVQEAGIPLQLQYIRLSPHRGWVLGNVKLYSTSPDDLQPLLSAKKLYVLFWPVDWKNISGGDWHVRVYVKDLGVSLGRPWESVLPETHPFRNVSRLNATLKTSADGHVAVENAELDWGGVTISAQGSTVIASAGSDWQNSVEIRRSAAKAADALSRLKCSKAPQLKLNFNYDDAKPAENFLTAVLSAEGLTLRDRIYKQFSGTFGYRDDTWTVSALQLSRTDREKLMARGSINLINSNTQVSVENTLSASDLFNLLPDDEQSAVAQTGIKPFGRLDFTASFGPAPFSLLAEKAEVHLQQAHVKRNDLTLDPIALKIVRDGSRIEATGIDGRINGGPLAGSFKFDLGSKAWTAKVQTQCDPSIAGAYDKDLQVFLRRFRFPAEQLKTDLTVSQVGPEDSLVIAGTLVADRFTCGGVPIGHLETFMVYSNQFLDLTPLHIVRAKEQFDGSVQVNLASGLAFFNVTNSFPPADIARALVPEERTILEDFRFNGPVYAVGRGQIDYGTLTNHNFSGTFRAENVSMEKIQSSIFNADIQGRGTMLSFTNAAMQLYGGFAKGSAEFDILLSDGSAPYRINANIIDLDLEQLLTQVTEGDYKRIRGQFSASVNLTADASIGFWKTVRGGGQVKVEKGRLADIPLFGGFSRLTQSVFPGFTLFSLTDFTADYELRDGAVWSDNAQLGGTLVSARGRGSYSPEKGINFTVAAEPFRQTGGDKEKNQLQKLAATALKEGTAPFLRLLEFKLEGPLEKPEWRFANLPKEVTEIPKEVSGRIRGTKDK